MKCDNKDCSKEDKCFFMKTKPQRQDLCKKCKSNKGSDRPVEDYYTVFQRNGY
jgi:hypothetical protein